MEAESVSYTVCQYYGIETSANSLGYIATWSKDKTLPELKASLETISKTANILITSIDRHFQEICAAGTGRALYRARHLGTVCR